MRITFRLTFDDYYDALQARSAKDRRIRQLAALALTVLLCVALLRAPTPQGGHPLFALVLAVIAVLGIVPLAEWLSKLSFKNSYRRATIAEPNKERTIGISESGFESLEPPQKDEWSSFTKYSESARSFILYKESSIYAILPKRVLDKESSNSLRRTFESKLSKR